jgi:predicted amidohydrolase
MNVALISLDQVWEDRAANLARCRELTVRAVALGAELVVFPELTLTGFTMDATSFAEPPDASETIAAFAALAREAGVHIAFGVVLEGASRPRNTLVVVDRAGRELGRYAKVHPFTYAGEADHYEGGEALVVVEVNDVAYGLSICYDLRFPELYAALAPACDALLVIANWPAPRIAHWETLLRARAIEGQCFVAGVNRTGSDGNGNDYPRSSRAYGPAGTVVLPQRTEDVIDVVGIDAAEVRAYRAAFPVLRDRRRDVYGAAPLRPARGTPPPGDGA